MSRDNKRDICLIVPAGLSHTSIRNKGELTNFVEPGTLGRRFNVAQNAFLPWRSEHITGSMCMKMPVWHSAEFLNMVPSGTGFLGSHVMFGNPPRLEFFGFHPLIASSSIRIHETHNCVRLKFHFSTVGMNASQSTSLLGQNHHFLSAQMKAAQDMKHCISSLETHCPKSGYHFLPRPWPAFQQSMPFCISEAAATIAMTHCLVFQSGSSLFGSWNWMLFCV